MSCYFRALIGIRFLDTNVIKKHEDIIIKTSVKYKIKSTNVFALICPPPPKKNNE